MAEANSAAERAPGKLFGVKGAREEKSCCSVQLVGRVCEGVPFGTVVKVRAIVA